MHRPDWFPDRGCAAQTRLPCRLSQVDAPVLRTVQPAGGAFWPSRIIPLMPRRREARQRGSLHSQPHPAGLVPKGPARAGVTLQARGGPPHQRRFSLTRFSLHLPSW